jgi:hypothetical protein
METKVINSKAPPKPIACYLRRVYLDRGGYVSKRGAGRWGQYFGLGERLYQYDVDVPSDVKQYSPSALFDYIRASNFAQAKRIVRLRFPALTLRFT